MPTLDPAELAVWRYGVISALLHRNEADGTLEDALILLASRQYRKLDGKVVSYSPETLRACLIISILQYTSRKSLLFQCAGHFWLSMLERNRLFYPNMRRLSSKRQRKKYIIIINGAKRALGKLFMTL